MRVTGFIAIIAAGVLAAAAPASAAESIQGQWYTQNKTEIVTIAPCGQYICGKLTKFIQAPKSGATTDVKNPDEKLRKRKLIGLSILSGFVADGTKWRGKIYDPNSGKTYRSIVTLGKGGKLSVEGCIAMFCQAQTWTKAG